jgi:hypothetical protein
VPKAAAAGEGILSSAEISEFVPRALEGVVTRTIARIRLAGKMAHDDLVCPPPVPHCDHPARRLALCAFHAQLSRRRRSARGASVSL